jgi:predicted MFS family arabinose efflux permease
MVTGAAIGTVAYLHLNLGAVWLAASAALLIAVIVALAAWRKPAR